MTEWHCDTYGTARCRYQHNDCPPQAPPSTASSPIPVLLSHAHPSTSAAPHLRPLSVFVTGTHGACLPKRHEIRACRQQVTAVTQFDPKACRTPPTSCTVTIFSLRHYASAPTRLLSSARRSVAATPDDAPTTSTAASPSPNQSKSSSAIPCVNDDADADTTMKSDSCSTGSLLMPTPTKFNFERMTASFELIEAEFVTVRKALPSAGKRAAALNLLPDTAKFVTAMNEVINLFDTLGTAFSFVRTDMDKKIGIVNRFNVADPTHYGNMCTAVDYELANDKARISPGDPPSFSRTLYRLMWALKFADILLDSLNKSFDPQSKLTASERTLKLCVSKAYEAALAEHHSWTIRRAVKSACMLLPTKETFMQRLGVQPEASSQYLSRLAVSMSPLVKRLYAFYEAHDILDLP